VWRLFTGERPMRGVGRLLRLGGMPRWMRPAVAGMVRLVGRGIEADGLLATGPRDAAGRAALVAARETLAARFAELTSGCDAVVCPVSALPALRHGTAARLVLAAAPCLLANLLDGPTKSAAAASRSTRCSGPRRRPTVAAAGCPWVCRSSASPAPTNRSSST
jgi:hypothetical protein